MALRDRAVEIIRLAPPTRPDISHRQGKDNGNAALHAALNLVEGFLRDRHYY